MENTFVKIFLLLYLTIYYGILFVLNSFLVYKKTGKNPYVFGLNKGVLSFVEKSIKITGVIIPAILSVFIISERTYKYLIPIHYLEQVYFDYIGVILMLFGFMICFSAQVYLNTSWRIGIELSDDIKLVTHGIFNYSRNPFFLGIFLSYVGFFFVLPNIISFSACIVYYLLIQIQVRFEEENLIKSVGTKYQDYFAKVRRWI